MNNETPMSCTYGYSSFHTLPKIVATNVEIQFKYILSFHICCQSLEVPFYFLRRGVPVLLFI